MPPVEDRNPSSVRRSHPYGLSEAPPPPSEPPLENPAANASRDVAQAAEANLPAAPETGGAASETAPDAEAPAPWRSTENSIVYLPPTSLGVLAAIGGCNRGEDPTQYTFSLHAGPDHLEAWVRRRYDLDKVQWRENPMYAYDIMLVRCTTCGHWRRWTDFGEGRRVVLKRRMEILCVPLTCMPAVTGVDKVACMHCGADDMPADAEEARREVLEAIRSHEVEMEIEIGIRAKKVGVKGELSFRIGTLDDMTPVPWETVIWTARETLGLCRRHEKDAINTIVDGLIKRKKE